ncbi:TPA: LTA synthase family protein [Streptococcus suis]
MVGDNQGNIKIVASQKKNDASISTDQKIQDIIINGHKQLEFSENQWIVEDITHLVEQSYYSPGGEQYIEIQSSIPITSLTLTNRELLTAGILQIYLDDKLYAEIDSFSTDQSLVTHSYVFPSYFMVSRGNIGWYIVSLLSVLIYIIFIRKKIYKAVPKKNWIALGVFIICSVFILEWAIGHHKLGYFSFFNSIFTKKTLYILVPTLLVHMKVVYETLYYLATKRRSFKNLNSIILGATYIAVPFVVFYILENSYSSYQNVENRFVWINIIAYSMIFVSLSWMLASFKRGGVLLLAIGLICGVATNVLIDTRNEPFLPYHIYQLTTGLNVAAKTEFYFTDKILQSFLLTIIYSGLLCLNPKKLSLDKNKIKINFTKNTEIKRLFEIPIKNFKLVSIGLALLFNIFTMPSILLAYSEQVTVELNPQRMQATYSKSGFFLAFSHYYMSSKVEKPEGYSEQMVSEVYTRFPGTQQQTDKMPNIIVIQNESQADYTQLTDLKFSVDPMSFQHSLKENTISGETYVSVFGGGTSNTEYEVLTSNALAGLPMNIFPFQQLVNKKSDSVVWTLSGYGYETIAMHPETQTNYRRKQVYDLLGFEAYFFKDSTPSIEDLFNVEYERSYVSDKSLYTGIMNLLENKVDDRPLFNFVVTMQGHGSYTADADSYKRTVSIQDVAQQDAAATEYLTSLRSSDEALKELVTFLKDYSEPTILVMYGDHHPVLSKEFFGNYLDSSDPSSIYKTPLLIWSNFDIPEKENVAISPNYIIPYLLHTLSETEYAIPVSSYYDYMYHLYQEVPIQTTWGYYTPKFELVTKPEESPLFDLYPYILYNQISGK